MIPTEVLAILEPIVKRFEGCRLEAYQDTGGRWTTGYGHAGPDVYEGLVWTQDQADTQLALDLDHAYTELIQLIPALTNESSTRQAALADFVYNLGVGTLAHSTLHSAIAVEAWQAVKTQLALWVHSGGKVEPGLVARRAAEIALI